ncbi:hypothetical protein GmHk_05G012688 [Glycine max]|nr:hypothetical protein GmHk_05G012688 [Glycine max]
MIQGLQAPHGATSPSTLKWTRKATRLRSLATRPVGAERPVVLVNPVAMKADSPHKKKLRTYLGIVARDKVDVTYENWKQVLAAYKDLIWGDIQTTEERWRQFKFDLTSKWALAADKDSVDDTVCEKYNISKEKWTQFCQSRRDHSWEDSLEEQASQDSFVAHGRQDVLTVVIGRQNTLVVDQLEESITEKVTRQLMLSFNQMQYQFQSRMQSQELALPSEPKVGPSAARVNTKESCVDPLGNDPDTGDSKKCRLYVKENPPHLVALGRLFNWWGRHLTPSLLGQHILSSIYHNMYFTVTKFFFSIKVFIVVKLWQLIVLDKHGTVGPVKPTDRLDNDVDDPIYLMTLTIPQLFLMSLEVMWDATMFGVFNDNFPLYIKYEDLSEIAQMVNVSTSLLYSCGFLHISKWLSFCLREMLLSGFVRCIIGQTTTSKELLTGHALKELNHTPQSKSKAAARWIIVKCNRQKGSTEYGYYVMHWMSAIILGSFKNNWETYFNDVKPLEPERLKALRIHWAIYYLKDKNETISV